MYKLLLLEDDISLIDGLQYALKKKWVSTGCCPDAPGGKSTFICSQRL